MAMHELILGGARSGKSRAAEERAAAWLATPGQRACLLATARAGDTEMAERIRRHQADRSARLPALVCVEVGADLAGALRLHGRADCLLVVDCLTLWLTQCAMPAAGPALAPAALQAATEDLVQALRQASGPVLLVSNEIGLGVTPMGAPTRRFVDLLGRLHQAVGACCSRITLMVAGHGLTVKGPSP
jgi:adenosylcobinamide kinase / adenosylcobinamide-phosphate guanylyltransferase